MININCSKLNIYTSLIAAMEKFAEPTENVYIQTYGPKSKVLTILRDGRESVGVEHRLKVFVGGNRRKYEYDNT